MKSQLLIALVLVYSIFTLAQPTKACGPGRAGGRRRSLRKYPPLVVRQYIPNVSENTLGASGRPEGAIKRKDKRFRELVQNWNPDIEFRDDEKTGADRMMSQRLKEKLSILAISVMNQWPNVKLRVIEGWDEDNRHTLNSLHYEGRAVDITTSDRDNSKYGMLARLAVEAGFDWVHYESRSHVHCSVKSEKADTIRNNGCFDAAAVVETPEGKMEMSQLQKNDLVLAMNSRNGQLQFSPIILWLDRDETGQELYVELKTKSNRLIRLTSSHLIYVSDEPPVDLTATKTRTQAYTSEPPESMDLMEKLPNTGNTDNNINNNDQNNYYYYETQGLEGGTATGSNGGGDKNAADDASNSTNVPNTNNVNQFVPNDFQTPSSLPKVLALDDVAYTTYARNVIIGQYLLLDLPDQMELRTKITPLSSTDAKQVSDPTRLAYEILDTEQKQPSGWLIHEKPDSRLVFDKIGRYEGLHRDDVQRAGSTGSRQKSIKFDKIVSVNYVTRRGIYAPLTREGNIVVNSVVASCYAVISDHEMAHMSFAPIRWYSYLNEWIFGPKPLSHYLHRTLAATRKSEETIQQRTLSLNTDIEQPNSKSYANQRITTGSNNRVIHWYPSMLYKIAKFILPTRYLY